MLVSSFQTNGGMSIDNVGLGAKRVRLCSSQHAVGLASFNHHR